MFEEIIEFSASESYLKTNPIHPILTKTNIPKWFKDLEHHPKEKTIKGCIPFLETLTAGYILKLPIDYHFKFNKDNESYYHNNPDTPEFMNKLFNIGTCDNHPIKQLGDKCPFIHKNKNFDFFKILNPWTIKTPKGYSCLFLPPMNNSNDKFSIIPGIVDTDTFPGEINFPIIMNGDKYPFIETTIKAGTPYVQIIPFKRTSWKMKIKKTNDKKSIQKRWYTFEKVFRVYQNIFWSKKTWK